MGSRESAKWPSCHRVSPPPNATKEHQPGPVKPRITKQPRQKAIIASIGDAMDPDAAESADRAARHRRERAEARSSSLTRMAKVLEDSAVLADAHAERHEQAGRSDAAARERQAAEHARQAAQRGRLHAEEWLEHSVDRKR